MKRISILIFAATLFQSGFSQERNQGFDWNKTFAGGSIVLGFDGGGSSQFTIGGNPEFGYSIFKNVDFGICGNYLTTSSNRRYETTNGISTEKIRLTLTGVGVFTRLHITQGFFIQLQPELNNIKYRRFQENPNITIEEGNFKSSSFLAGVGFGTRDVGRSSFFTLILIDLQKDVYSPYRTPTGEISPVIRSGFTFYFGRKGK